MIEQNKRRLKRIINLIMICAFTTVIFSISTYAWFVGMQVVNVSSFEIEIQVADSLALSLTGDPGDFGTSVTLTSDNFEEGWSEKGLIPMSSIGDMDASASRMMLYEKSSYTPTPGGYRLLATRVDNYNTGKSEQDGYAVFDLYIKNFSGTKYYTEHNVLNEEAIYLTVDSEVTVGANGLPNTGIENSIRVAFAQIGRVAGTTATQGTITGIKCIPGEGETEVTGICRTAKIWEPNDTNHVTNAIKWYGLSCLKRGGEDGDEPKSYGGDCGQVVDGLSYPTFAVKDDIAPSDAVDVYDGPPYNSFESPKLTSSYLYFTDTMKVASGKARKEFMSLAPNSITKVRVYVYLEGQDIDNYDYALVGKAVSIKFGFTKSQLTEDDIDYDGPDVNQGAGPDGADKTPPVITLNGDAEVYLEVGPVDPYVPYVDAGATAKDNIDGDIDIEEIEKSGTVNTSVLGTYTIVYKATDAAGNVAVKVRTVNVVEELPEE